MKISYFKVNPGGNTTAIVKGRFSKKTKLLVTKKILKNDPIIEQVGFWTSPRNKIVDARLEMSGGEFCGNALRALGGIIFLQTKKSLLLLESSGTKEIVQVDVNKKISTITLPLKGFQYQNSVCSLPGISYVFTSNKITKESAIGMLKKNNLIKLKASGVIGCQKTQVGFTIKPIVWVRDVKTLYIETACGSGTIALSVREYKKNNIKKLIIKQPSGYNFYTEINDDYIKLSGPIVSIESKEI